MASEVLETSSWQSNVFVHLLSSFMDTGVTPFVCFVHAHDPRGDKGPLTHIVFSP